MEKQCVFLGIKSDSFKDKETGDLISYARLHIWDPKNYAASVYPFPNKDVEEVTAKFGDEVSIELVEGTNFKTGAAQLKAVSCTLL